MKIVQHRPLEDCFEESLTQELGLDQAIDESFILYLQGHGDLQYFPQFSRPFFKLMTKDRWTITGIAGNMHFRVTLCHENKAENIYFLEELVSGYQQ